MNTRSRCPQIALIGFPILERRTNPVTHALAGMILQEKHWEIALAAREGPGGIRLAEKMGCHGALVRLTDRETARVARRSHIAMVNVSGWLSAPGVATVKCDNAAIGRLAALHLAEKNYKHLAVLIAPGGALNIERYRGFADHAVRINLPVESFDSRKRTRTSDKVDRKALARWLKRLDRPTGLFLTDDTLALTLQDSLRECGISVPHDIGIVCGSLYPERGGLCSPSLTSVDPNTAGVYRRAVERLEHMMRRSRVLAATMELLEPAGLCPGESTRLQASDDPLVAGAIRLLDAEGCRGMNINQLCARLGVACSTLERHFKNALGIMPHAYLTKLRLDMAKAQLVANDRSLEKIAGACGFSSRKRLNQIFRASEGLSPRKWRDKHLAKARP